MQYWSICLSKIKKCVWGSIVSLMEEYRHIFARLPFWVSWNDRIFWHQAQSAGELRTSILVFVSSWPKNYRLAILLQLLIPGMRDLSDTIRHNKWLRNKWRRLVLSASQKIGTCTRRCFFMCMCFIRRSASTKKKTLGYQLGISTGFPNWCMTTKVQINMEWPSWAMCMLNVEYKQDRKANSLKGTVHHLFNFKPVWFSFYIGNQTTMTFMF